MRHEGGFGGERNFAPVKVGQVIDAKVEAVGEKGDGIIKIKGFVIFVPNVKQGDEVKVKINKVLRKVAFGEVVTGEAASEASESSEQSEESSQESDSYKEEQPQESQDSENF